MPLKNIESVEELRECKSAIGLKKVMKTHIEKFGWAKTSLAKAELLHTFEDLGLKE